MIGGCRGDFGWFFAGHFYWAEQIPKKLAKIFVRKQKRGKVSEGEEEGGGNDWKRMGRKNEWSEWEEDECFLSFPQ